MTEAEFYTAEEQAEQARYEQAAWEDAQEAEQEDLEEVIILDDASAEYLLRRIAEADAELERLTYWYKRQLEKAKQIHDRTVEWATRSLRGYFNMVPAKETKTQRKYELPGGTLLLKAQQPKYEVVDAELVPWLKENGRTDMIRIKEETAWADLKKELHPTPDGTGMMTADGEILPGVLVIQRDPVFTATPNTKKN